MAEHSSPIFPVSREAEYGAASRVIADLYRTFGDRSNPHTFVELVERETVLRLHAPIPARLGTGFSLNAANASHSSYKNDLNVAAATSAGIAGANTKVAVLDTGIDPGMHVASWRDLTGAASKAKVDNNGHGSAMTAIIQDVAKGASIHAIRISDSGQVYLWDLMAGLQAAVFSDSVDIVSMSLGIKSFSGACGQCGQGSNQSAIFQDFFDRVHQGAGNSGAPDPIFLASVGNDADPNGFNWPAAYDNTVAIGAVTLGKQRPTFSNTGTTKTRYFLGPGGDVDANNDVTEWIGEGNDNGTPTHCAGTSPATAYAAGILSLYRDYRVQNGLSTTSNAILDRAANNANADVKNETGNKIRLVYGT